LCVFWGCDDDGIGIGSRVDGEAVVDGWIDSRVDGEVVVDGCWESVGCPDPPPTSACGCMNIVANNGVIVWLCHKKDKNKANSDETEHGNGKSTENQSRRRTYLLQTNLGPLNG
ncbi:reverse transcriptase domain-containing protein, partial [Tanacetum coccineum]